MGELKIRELRRKAESELGPRFDVARVPRRRPRQRPRAAARAGGADPRLHRRAALRALKIVLAALACGPRRWPSLPRQSKRLLLCAACVTWRATPARPGGLLDAPGRLDGLDVLVAVESAADIPRAAEAAARDWPRGERLVERGAAPRLPGRDLAAAGRLVARILLAPARRRGRGRRARVRDQHAGHRGARGVRRRPSSVSTAPRRPCSRRPGAASARTCRFLVPDRRRSVLEDAGRVRMVVSGAPVTSLEDLLARTARTPRPAAGRSRCAKRDVALARPASAADADVLPAGLTALDTVTLCERATTACATPVFLHPRHARRRRRRRRRGRRSSGPGATRAFAPSLSTVRGDRALPLVLAGGRDGGRCARPLRSVRPAAGGMGGRGSRLHRRSRGHGGPRALRRGDPGRAPGGGGAAGLARAHPRRDRLDAC